MTTTQAQREYQKEYREKNKEKIRAYYQKNIEKYRAYHRNLQRTVRKSDLKRRAYQMWFAARDRSRKAGVPFSLTRERVEKALRAGICEVTGLLLVLDGSTRLPRSPSLDRTVPGAGYTNENTKMVTWMYNTAKNAFRHEDVIEMARALLAREENQA